jgi:NAD(P)-dependent dehydrogenase (short-subunit alcohol dehydrogenase family)
MAEAPEGRVWLITGCSGGFGRAVAEEALRRGDCVIGTLRRREQFAAFEALAPGRSHALELDVRDGAQIASAVALAVGRYGRIDVLFNNAGYGLLGAIEETSIEEARGIFETNFFGLLQVTQALLPQLRVQGGGRILNMSSGAGVGAVPGLGLYSATKFAVEGMTEALAAEVAALGIKVTLIEPGAFNTGFPAGGIVETRRRLAAYATFTGHGAAGMRHWYGAHAGNPADAASAIVRIAGEPDPPLRLVLGADALGGVRRKLDLLREDFDRWEALSLSTAR